MDQISALPQPASLEIGQEEIAKARAVATKSPRESDYIEALGGLLTDTDSSITVRARWPIPGNRSPAHNHPDDREAKIFVCAFAACLC